MTEKNVITDLALFNATAMTGTITSTALNVLYLDDIGLEITWTGTPTGTITVNGSIGGVNYYALTFNPVLTQPAGSAGGYLVDLTQFPFRWLTVSYTASSGSGNLTVLLTAKEI